jgi:hypothetical protein
MNDGKMTAALPGQIPDRAAFVVGIGVFVWSFIMKKSFCLSF